jgi:hypothetical protein
MDKQKMIAMLEQKQGYSEEVKSKVIKAVKEKEAESFSNTMTIETYDIQVFDLDTKGWNFLQWDTTNASLADLRQDARNIADVDDEAVRIVKQTIVINTETKAEEKNTVKQVGRIINSAVLDNFKITCLACEAKAIDFGVKLPKGWGFIHLPSGCFYACPDHKD